MCSMFDLMPVFFVLIAASLFVLVVGLAILIYKH